MRNNLPTYVAVPTMPAQDAGSGYLSSSYAPFSLGSDPANGGFRVQDLARPGNVTPDRFATRRTTLDAVNAGGAERIEEAVEMEARNGGGKNDGGVIEEEKVFLDPLAEFGKSGHQLLSVAIFSSPPFDFFCESATMVVNFWR